MVSSAGTYGYCQLGCFPALGESLLPEPLAPLDDALFGDRLMRKPALPAQVGYQRRKRLRRPGAEQLLGGVGADVGVVIGQCVRQRRDARRAGRTTRNIACSTYWRNSLSGSPASRSSSASSTPSAGVAMIPAADSACRLQQFRQRASGRPPDLAKRVGGPGKGLLAVSGKPVRARQMGRRVRLKLCAVGPASGAVARNNASGTTSSGALTTSLSEYGGGPPTCMLNALGSFLPSPRGAIHTICHC